jgi:hypothetical protein
MQQRKEREQQRRRASLRLDLMREKYVYVVLGTQVLKVRMRKKIFATT